MIWMPCVHRSTTLSYTNNANKITTLIVLVFQVNELRLIKICLSGTLLTCPAGNAAACSGSTGSTFFSSRETQQESFPMHSLNWKLISYFLAIMLATSNMTVVSTC